MNNLPGPCAVKRGRNASPKSIDSCQPAQSAQADMFDTFCVWVYFLHFRMSILS